MKYESKTKEEIGYEEMIEEMEEVDMNKIADVRKLLEEVDA